VEDASGALDEREHSRLHSASSCSVWGVAAPGGAHAGLLAPHGDERLQQALYARLRSERKASFDGRPQQKLLHYR
jgi:hypothetical protein